jgi:hypothetical protein
MKEISDKKYWFLKGYEASERYNDEENPSNDFKWDLENEKLEVAWTTYCPMMLADYLQETVGVPKEYMKDYIDGVELSQDKRIFYAYLNLKGVK